MPPVIKFPALFALLLLAIPGSTPAADLTVAELPPMAASFVKSVLWQEPEVEVRIEENPDTPEKATIRVPAKAASHRGQVGLLFQGRFDFPHPAGLSFRSLGISVNGNPLSPAVNPLLNRSTSANTFPAMQGYPIRWWVDFEGAGRLTVQAVPGFDSWNTEILEGEEEGHWYLLDISEFFQPGKENLIEITFYPPQRTSTSAPGQIVLENICLVAL